MITMITFDLHKQHCKYDGTHFDISNEICEWLYENDILYNIEFPNGNSFIMLIANTISFKPCIIITFYKEEDAVLFKLKWL